MRRTGFTLIEVLICIGIIATVTAICVPVASLALAAARRGSATQNLHQLYLATVIYQADWGESVIYGSPEDMGLPSITARKSVYGIFDSTHGGNSPCGRNPYKFFQSMSVGY